MAIMARNVSDPQSALNATKNRHAWPDAALSRGALYSTTNIEVAAIFA
jgi:hypothetical protein